MILYGSSGFRECSRLSVSIIVHLAAARAEGADFVPRTPNRISLGDVAKIEAHAPAIGAAVLSSFLPDHIGLVTEPPGLHHIEALGQHRVRDHK